MKKRKTQQIHAPDDAKRYQQMAREYRTACASWRGRRPAGMAIAIGAKAFGVTVAQLQSYGRQRSLVHARQKVMAFARVISEESREENSFSHIGRLLKRKHNTVIHALEKYGSAVRVAIISATLQEFLTFAILAGWPQEEENTDDAERFSLCAVRAESRRVSSHGHADVSEVHM